MRSFRDGKGNSWQATLGRESFGTVVLLFSSDATGEVRKVVLQSETPLDAEGELGRLTEDELRSKLEYSLPWE